MNWEAVSQKHIFFPTGLEHHRVLYHTSCQYHCINSSDRISCSWDIPFKPLPGQPKILLPLSLFRMSKVEGCDAFYYSAQHNTTQHGAKYPNRIYFARFGWCWKPPKHSQKRLFFKPRKAASTMQTFCPK